MAVTGFNKIHAVRGMMWYCGCTLIQLRHALSDTVMHCDTVSACTVVTEHCYTTEELLYCVCTVIQWSHCDTGEALWRYTDSWGTVSCFSVYINTWYTVDIKCPGFTAWTVHLCLTIQLEQSSLSRCHNLKVKWLCRRDYNRAWTNVGSPSPHLLLHQEDIHVHVYPYM